MNIVAKIIVKATRHANKLINLRNKDLTTVKIIHHL